MAYGDYPDLTSVKKVLVIKLRQIGDVLLTGPVFSTLKNHLPQAEIDAFIYSDSVPILEGHPAITTIFSYDRNWKRLSFCKRLALEWRCLMRLRRQKYDLVINLTEGDRGAIVAKFSGALIRVGFNPKQRVLFGKLYTHIAKHCASLRHTVERNLDAIRRIGIFPTPRDKELFLPIAPEALQKNARANQGAVSSHSSYFALAF